jgi:tetratricopeptide (TPR) repeat protein
MLAESGEGERDSNMTWSTFFRRTLLCGCLWLGAFAFDVEAQTGLNTAPVEISPKISTYFNSVLQADTTVSVGLREQLAQALQKKDIAAALQQLQTITVDDKSDALVAFIKSQLMLLQQNDAGARQVLSEVWKKGSRDSRVTAALAQLCFSYLPNRLPDLIDFLPQAANVPLYTPLNPMTMACALYARGDATSADALAVKTAGSDVALLASYHGKCGEIELLGKNPSMATLQFEKAVALSPEPADAWLMNLTTLQLKWKKYNQARTYAEMLLKRDPKNKMALQKHSTACFYLNDYVAARETLLRLKDLDSPPDPQVLERLRQVEAKLAALKTAAAVPASP